MSSPNRPWLGNFLSGERLEVSFGSHGRVLLLGGASSCIAPLSSYAAEESGTGALILDLDGSAPSSISKRFDRVDFRALLYDGRWPPLNQLGYAALWAVVMLWIGSVVFRRFEPRLAEEL